MQFHGADFQSAGPEAAEISAGRDFCVPSGKFSGVSEEPLSGQWTERALSADRHTGIVRDLWGNHRQMQAGRVTGIENGGQRKGENMRISVAMATYNGARFITEQLDSIRLQSLPVDQVILRDDGSSDQTLEIVREYLETYELAPAWRITQNGKRLGYAENFRAAVEETDGDYVFFCDQDDIWEPDRVEDMVSEMENGERYWCWDRNSYRLQWIPMLLLSAGAY